MIYKLKLFRVFSGEMFFFRILRRRARGMSKIYIPANMLSKFMLTSISLWTFCLRMTT